MQLAEDKAFFDWFFFHKVTGTACQRQIGLTTNENEPSTVFRNAWVLISRFRGYLKIDQASGQSSGAGTWAYWVPNTFCFSILFALVLPRTRLGSYFPAALSRVLKCSGRGRIFSYPLVFPEPISRTSLRNERHLFGLLQSIAA